MLQMLVAGSVGAPSSWALLAGLAKERQQRAPLLRLTLPREPSAWEPASEPKEAASLSVPWPCLGQMLTRPA